MNYGIRPPGYCLPDETRIGAVRLQVSDLKRSRAFYQQILGFDVVNETSNSLRLAAHGRILIELQAGATTPLPPRHLGLYHFAILLPDRASLGRCLTHLAQRNVRLGASDHLVSEALYLSDPDGLGIEIYRDRPRPEWRTHGHEIAMATHHLDFESVMAAANGSAWNGMPAGTVIGHLHLHVGDIEEARRFYHEALGFDLMAWSYPGALFFSAGGYHHRLGTNTWAGPSATAPAATAPRLLEWDLVLPATGDVAAAAQSLLSAGFTVAPEEIGGSIATDPWGTEFRLTTAAASASF